MVQLFEIGNVKHNVKSISQRACYVFTKFGKAFYVPVSNEFEKLISGKTIFTPWGEVEEQIVYDYIQDEKCSEYHQIERAKFKSTFDNNNHLTHYINEERNRETGSWKKSKCFYDNEYDNNNRILRTTSYYFYNGRKYSDTNEYDTDGNICIKKIGETIVHKYSYRDKMLVSKEYYTIVEKTLFGQDVLFRGGTYYTYDRNNNLLLVVDRDGKGYEVIKKENEYDDAGNLIKTTRNTYNRKIITSYIDGIEYISKSFTYIEGKDYIIDHLENRYDSNGNLVSKRGKSNTYVFDNKRKMLVKDKTRVINEVLEYEYDENGNWIRKSIFKDNVLKYIVLREICYWK